MKNAVLPEDMICFPTVFAVGNSYQIFILMSREAIVRVRVGDRTFYDDACGVLRSGKQVHTVELPMSVLDSAGEYCVVWNNVIERKPYFPTSEPEASLTLPFRPLPREGKINIYHIADAHNMVDEPVSAGRYFGEQLHLLVLNGDIPDHSGLIENFYAICKIASGVTGGECPVVCARGNHDSRGVHAEDMPDYIPTQNGKTYYSFRLGRVWGLVLDCGEDKPDEHDAYGGMNCFHDFRLRQTDYIRSVIARAATEYAAEGVEHRLIISHAPFTHVDPPPFDIEQELYAEWARLIREHIKPTLQLHGHKHFVGVMRPYDEYDDFGLACPAIIGAKPLFQSSERSVAAFIGAAVTLSGDKITVTFNQSTGEIVDRIEL